MQEGKRTASTADDAMLSCRGLWKVFGPHANSFFAQGMEKPDVKARLRQMREQGSIPAVCDVSFDVCHGEIFVVMGLSGSGKSTVIRCLSRLIEPSAGSVHLEGEDLLAASPARLKAIRRHKMGMVFQSFGLMPHLTVLDNVAFPLRIQGWPLAKRMARALEMIALVGLEGREMSFPHELSGGQQQRVGIARSLAVEPDIWLLDEPFSALDPLIRRQMQDEFLSLQRMLRKTIVFITHDFLEAIRLADRIAIMNAGRIVQLGTPAEIVLRPVDRYVAEFTQDAPLAKVITAADIAEPEEMAGAVGGTRVEARTTLEELLSRFSRDPATLTAVDETGRALGRVTLTRALQVLAEHPDQVS